MDSECAICVECKKPEKDASKILTCMYCFSEAHYKCRNITGNAARRIKEKMYFCSHNCSSIYQRIIEMQNHKTSIVESLAVELKGAVANAVSQEIQNFRCEVKQITTAIEKSQDFLSSKFDGIVTDFQELKKENESLKHEIHKLKNNQQTLSKTVNKLEHQVDKSSREKNCNNAVVLGVPFVPDENTEEIVQKMISGFGVAANFDGISSATRINAKNRPKNSLVPIRVVFKDENAKEMVFTKKKECGKLLSSSIDPCYTINGKPTTVTMRDELTPLSLELLTEMRGYQDKLQLKYVWSSRGGNVLIKKNENSKPEIIKNRDDLNELVNRYSKNSPSKETPSPKRKCNNNVSNN